MSSPSHNLAARGPFNPGDNLHMNDAEYQAMADAIDLRPF